MILRAALLGAVALAVTAAPAAAARRFTVGLFGDSVAESATLAHPDRDGLAPRLVDELAHARGWSAAGPGFEAPTPAHWRFNATAAATDSSVPPGGWLLVGYYSVPGVEGLSGYSALTQSQNASARLRVKAREVTLLYTAKEGTGPFTVSAGNRTWMITPAASGPAESEARILVHPPVTVTVHGPATGELWLNGAVVRRTAPHHRAQVEVDNLGHAGRGPSEYLSDRIAASLHARHYDLSIFAWGYLASVFQGDPAALAALERGVLEHARIARDGGGACLIVDPTPLPTGDAIAAAVRAQDRRLARQGGCSWSGALAHLWASPEAGYRHGLTQVDRFHPTTKGYRAIAKRLAPVVRRLLRSSEIANKGANSAKVSLAGR